MEIPWKCPLEMSHRSACRQGEQTFLKFVLLCWLGSLCLWVLYSWFIITPSFNYSWYVCCLGDQLARRTFSQALADLKGPGMISSSDYSALTFPVINGWNTLNTINYHFFRFFAELLYLCCLLLRQILFINWCHNTPFLYNPSISPEDCQKHQKVTVCFHFMCKILTLILHEKCYLYISKNKLSLFSEAILFLFNFCFCFTYY